MDYPDWPSHAVATGLCDVGLEHWPAEVVSALLKRATFDRNWPKLATRALLRAEEELRLQS
jgi:hypothetical protein